MNEARSPQTARKTARKTARHNARQEKTHVKPHNKTKLANCGYTTCKLIVCALTLKCKEVFFVNVQYVAQNFVNNKANNKRNNNPTNNNLDNVYVTNV